MKLFLVAALMVGSTTASAVNLVCFNKNVIGPKPLQISFDANGATLTAKGESCVMTPISYKPNSPQYKGWVRTGSDQSNCKNLGAVLLGENSINKEGLEIYWVSYSVEAQAGKEGWVQLGYQNDWDPGAGAVAKTMLRCFPPRN